MTWLVLPLCGRWCGGRGGYSSDTVGLVGAVRRGGCRFAVCLLKVCWQRPAPRAWPFRRSRCRAPTASRWPLAGAVPGPPGCGRRAAGACGVLVRRPGAGLPACSQAAVTGLPIADPRAVWRRRRGGMGAKCWARGVSWLRRWRWWGRRCAGSVRPAGRWRPQLRMLSRTGLGLRPNSVSWRSTLSGCLVATEATRRPYDRTWCAGGFRPNAWLPRVVGTVGDLARLSGLDDQISWPTAERTAPDLACISAVGYSVNRWIDGKEKVYGSIP
jgi:hypothetical protein